MEKILDVIFTKHSTFKTRDPYSLALAIKEIASRYGDVKEKIHEYDTNGPRKIIRIVFDVKNNINKHTSARLTFQMKGEIGVTSFLDVKVIGKSMTSLNTRHGMISNTYGDYYIRSIYPILKKETDIRLREIIDLIEQDIKSVLNKYA